jgi:hypothetical protein
MLQACVLLHAGTAAVHGGHARKVPLLRGPPAAGAPELAGLHGNRAPGLHENRAPLLGKSHSYSLHQLGLPTAQSSLHSWFLAQVLVSLGQASNGGTNPAALRQSVPQDTVTGLFRDMRGIAIATNSRRTYGVLDVLACHVHRGIRGSALGSKLLVVGSHLDGPSSMLTSYD